MISIFDPHQRVVQANGLLTRIDRMATRTRKPLSDQSVDLLSAISERILADPFGRRSPRFIAVAYWLRRAALKRLITNLRDELKADDNSIILSARGTVLHLPPTNVDTIFLYSWALSVLAGNCNIVRLPSQPDDATKWLAELTCTILTEFGEQESQLFCTFPHESALLEQISERCDGRMIWGGDKKVLDVSRTPTRPDGLSLGFPDRTSVAIFSSLAYLNADDMTRNKLAESLFNDIFWFDQMGCGSPRIFFWVGDTDAGAASEDLAERLRECVIRKNYSVDTSVALQKLNFAAGLLANGAIERLRQYSNELYVLQMHEPPASKEEKQGGGIIYSVKTEKLDIVADWADHSLQTVVHFGFTKAELTEFARSLAGRGGFRLVPPGSALQFHPIWDGVPLVGHLTRRIVVISDH